MLSSDSEMFNNKYSKKIDRDNLDEPYSPMKRPKIIVKDLNEGNKGNKGPKLSSNRSGQLKFSKDEI